MGKQPEIITQKIQNYKVPTCTLKFITVTATPLVSTGPLRSKVIHQHFLQAFCCQAEVANSQTNVRILSNITIVKQEVKDNPLSSSHLCLPSPSSTSLHQIVKHGERSHHSNDLDVQQVDPHDHHRGGEVEGDVPLPAANTLGGGWPN